MATDKNFVIKNGLTVGTSEVITSAGNLTNIGTIDSGAITADGLTVDTTTLVVDATNNRVGIGTSSPSYPLEVQSGGVGTVLRAGTSFVSIDPTGSESAPSLIFNGDANTGIWRPASDTLAVSTAGTERMRISNSVVDVNVFLDLNDNYITGVNSYRNVNDAEIIDANNTSYTIVKSYAGVNRLWLGESATYLNNTNIYLRDASSNHLVTINSTGLNIRSGGLDINSLEVIDSSRNLTNIGTISSGVHTITSSGTIGGSTLSNAYLKITDNTDTMGLDVNEIHTTDNLYLLAEGGEVVFRDSGNAGVILKNGGTAFMDASRNLTNIGTISSGQVNATTTADATPTIIATNTGGLNATIQRWVGDANGMELRNYSSSGDYVFVNNEQDNGFLIFDGTGGVDVLYNGSTVQSWDSGGGTDLVSGDFKVGGTTVLQSATNSLVNIGAVTASDLISTDSHVQSGDGSGGVALTINDGYGNANVTFNHLGGVPEQNGNSARIEVNTDATSSATMYFEVASNVTSGVAVQTANIFGADITGIFLNSGKTLRGSTELTLTADDMDFIVEDNTDSTTNFIWRDHSGSKLYLGTSTAQVELRSSLNLQAGYNISINGSEVISSSGVYGGTLTSSQVTTALGYTPYQESTALSATTGVFSSSVNIDNTLNLDARYDGSQEKALAFKDSGGNYSISHNVNDGNGNYSISIGYSGAGSGEYAVTNDGVGKILFGGHGRDGAISLNAAPVGTAGNNISFSIGLLVDGDDNTIRVGASANGTGMDTGAGTKVFDASANAFATSYSVGATTVIDSSGNLTNIGTISSGAIYADGGTVQHQFISSSDGPIISKSTDSVSGIGFEDNSATNYLFYVGSSNHFYFNSGTLSVGGATLGTGNTFNVAGGIGVSGTTVISSTRVGTFPSINLDDQIISTGDTNTYMQFHAADQWRVVTGGSERLEVNNTRTSVNNGYLQVTGSTSHLVATTTATASTTRIGLTATNQAGIVIDTSSTAVTGSARIYRIENISGNRLRIGNPDYPEALAINNGGSVSSSGDFVSTGLTIGSWTVGSNTGQGRIGKASDRSTGVITNQMGTSSGYWEIVDYAWSVVAAQCTNAGDFTAYRDFNSNTGGYKINGTTVIDSSRNLTNIAKITGNSASGGTTTFNVGRGDVYFENNSGSNADGAGITLRTSVNPSTGSIFDIRSSGQAVRLFIGQDLSSMGRNPFYVGGSAAESALATASSYTIELSSAGDITAEGNVTAYGSISDIRQKENIEQIDKPIERLEKIKGITFNYKKKSEDERLMGVIAQDLLEDDILKLAVYEQEDFKAEDDDPLKHTYGVRYEHLTAILIEAVKNQQKQIEELKEQVSSLTPKN